MISKASWIIMLAALLIGFQAVQARTITREQEFEFSGQEAEIRLDIDAAEVFLEPGPGNVCKVFLEYNEGKFTDQIKFTEKRNLLKIRLDGHGLRFWGNRDRYDEKGNDFAAVRIIVPENVKIAFDSKIKAGDIEMSLGNLSLTNFRLQAWAGVVTIDFDQPNRTRMELMDINVKVGETRLRNLGNANCDQLEINGGIGEMLIDFNGTTIERTTAYIDLDIGETTVVLPEKVGIKMQINKFLFMSDTNLPSDFVQKGRFVYSPNYRDQDNMLYLRISPGLGQLVIEENDQSW